MSAATATVFSTESTALLSGNDTLHLEEQEGGDTTTSRRNRTTANVLESMQCVFSSSKDTATTANTANNPGTRRGVSSSETPARQVTQDEETSPFFSILYGLTNAAIETAIGAAYGNIIFSDGFFRPYLPKLMKLTVMSGFVHQVAFSTFSSLPFAVGQVQDAGLIFLSAMASNMVAHCRQRANNSDTTVSDEAILATVTIGLSLSTALVGLVLILIRQCQLASVASALPTPVVGAYLGFVGYYCGQVGLDLMVSTTGGDNGGGVNVSHLWEWNRYFASPEHVRLVLPGIAGGFFLYASVRTIRHIAVMPVTVFFLLMLFYSVLLLTGTSVATAREEGWISQGEPSSVWYEMWDFFQWDRVIWSAFPPNILRVAGLTFVVAFGSSLDITAIELEIGHPLDYNHELGTVGLSNVFSGLTGGYTGSYIFSQSIFNLRSGIRSRLSGFALAFVQGFIVMIPVPILSFLPNCFFGALLISISVDLLHDWLWQVRSKVSNVEYVVVWATFGFLLTTRMEIGIFLGTIVCLVLKKVLGSSSCSSSCCRDEVPAASEVVVTA